MTTPFTSSVVVPGLGRPDAKIVIVGEAPGSTEIAKRMPFVGPAGDMLNELLQNAGIARHECYLTNVVKQQPRGNDISLLIQKTSKEVVCTQEYLNYEQQLYSELSQLSPNVIVATGNVPLYALTRKWGITKWRGSILQSPMLDGRKVVATLHPSAVMRDFIQRYPAMLDMRRVKEESGSPLYDPPHRLIYIRPSFNEAMSFLARCKTAPQVGYDIEASTKTKAMTCFAFALDAFEAMCFPLLDERGHDYFTIDQETAIIREMGEILENPNITKVGQNLVGFDAPYNARVYGIKMTNIHDTMIAHKILFPDFPMGLDFQTSYLTREPYYKDDGKEHIRLGTGSIDEFWNYNGKDACMVMEIMPKLIRDLMIQDNIHTYNIHMELANVLLYMQQRGILIDSDSRILESRECEVKIEELKAKLEQLCGKVINSNSPKQVKDYFYGDKGLKPYKNRGKETADEEAMKRLARAGNPEATVILDIRKERKYKGTYLEMQLDHDGRARSQMTPITKTGRFTSSKTFWEVGGNLQTLPARFKKHVVADPGYLGYELDLAQAENRIVAYIAPEPQMIEAFENKVDVHRKTASLLFDKPVEEISDDEDVKHGRKPPSPIGNGTRSERYWGKQSNHSLNYDISYQEFALHLEIPERDAKFLKDKYLFSYPGVSQYHAWIQEELRQTRTLTNPFGRRRKFFGSLSGNEARDTFKEAYAQIPQSTVAHIINERGLLYLYNNQAMFHGVEILNQVHDSIVLQIPISLGLVYHAQVLGLLVESLTQPINWRAKSFVIPVDCKAFTRLGSAEGIDLTPTQLLGSIKQAYEHLQEKTQCKNAG
jgi:uracil-DNA glycosylase family 4